MAHNPVEMRIVLFGKHGQLGGELFNSLKSLVQVYAYDWPDVDFLAPASIKRLIVTLHPDMVINAAAYTNVDKAESEAERARLINTEAPSLMAETCRTLGAAFVHYSTDYVFDGNKGTPYMEEDIPNPLNVYGRSKLEGEHAVLAAGGISLILRTAWVYGTSKDSFVNKVLRWAHSQSEMRIVEDQVSNPTWARALAKITTHLIVKAGSAPVAWLDEHRGLYHIAGWGFTSRLDWAKAILRYDPRANSQLVQRVLPARTMEFPTAASRPLFSALNCSKFEKTFALRLPDWESALSLAMRTQIGIDNGSKLA
jgi:dTDP-4-dehydrorhamnose reductase